MQEKNTKLIQLLQFVTSEGRICPMPKFWNELWELLPDRKSLPGGGSEPALPLILAAWHSTPNILKIARLREHIEYAASHDALETVDTYLRSLKLEDWLVAV